MPIISVFETFLYYCCINIFAQRILNCSSKRWVFYGSFLLFLPLLYTAFTKDLVIYNSLHLTFIILQFVLLKIIYKNIQLHLTVIIYAMIYCFNVIFISILLMCTMSHSLLLDLIVNTLTVSCFISICATKFRYKLYQILQWTPRYILIVASLLLILSALLTALLTDRQLYTHQNQWTGTTHAITIILLLSLCIGMPILMLVAISNNRLKTQNAMYEQQLLAQAEHYEKQAKASYEIKKFKHDFKNLCIGLEALLIQRNYSAAKKMLQDIRNATAALLLNTPYNTGSEIVDALLADKQASASQYNTTIQFNGCLPKNYLSPQELCIVFGNTIDNALEACQRINQAEPKTISIHCNSCGGVLTLSIQNPIAAPVLIRDNHIATTKNDKTLHGFGLPSLYSVIKKYDGDVKLEATSETFTIYLELLKI